MKKTAITLFFLLQAACLFSQIPRLEYPRPQFERTDWINLNGEWTYTFDFGRKRPGTRLRRLEGIRRQNHRAVRPGEQALGRRPHGLHRPHLVPAYDRHSGRLVGTQRDAQLRSRVLHLRGVCRRPLRWTPLRRQHVVLLRHHRIREAGRQPQSGRLRHERPCAAANRLPANSRCNTPRTVATTPARQASGRRCGWRPWLPRPSHASK